MRFTWHEIFRFYSQFTAYSVLLLLAGLYFNLRIFNYYDVHPTCTVYGRLRLQHATTTNMQTAKYLSVERRAATKIPRYGDNGSITDALFPSPRHRDDKSGWKPESIRASDCAETRSADISNNIGQTSQVLWSRWVSCSFFLFLLVSRYLSLFLVAPPRFLTDMSRGNDKSSRCSDGPQFGEHFYLTVATAATTFRTLRAQ